MIREGLSETLNWRHVYDDFDEAMETAKIWARCHRCSIEDQTTHH